MIKKISPLEYPLNGICPYFTMFPLDFPKYILAEHAKKGEIVLDPFCGRGTTNFAARTEELHSIGIDSSPVAVAIAQAKTVLAKPEMIVKTAKDILSSFDSKEITPSGEFWEYAFHPDVLKQLCHLRASLLKDCRSHTRKALRGILLGALHGPLGKQTQSYFSNQCPRTFAPKPAYSVRFWKAKDMQPPNLDVITLIEHRAKRYFSQHLPSVSATVKLADSRMANVYSSLTLQNEIDWIITSPPYYGMNTYIPDQWLRLWFLGEAPAVKYRDQNQLAHSSPVAFAENLRQVWKNSRSISSRKANLVIRFGGIRSRKAEPLSIVRDSLIDSGWEIKNIISVGSAKDGNRQASYFSKSNKEPMEEYDIWATPL